MYHRSGINPCLQLMLNQIIERLDQFISEGLFQAWIDIKYTMYKDIQISQKCTQICVKNHPTDRSHKKMDLKRFKNRIREFLSQDDEYWLPAFEKLQEMEQILRDFRTEFEQRINEKRLLYCLNYDTDGIFLKIFKKANNDQFDKLTCEDAALIENRVDKGRTINPAQIKTIISELLQTSAQTLRDKIERVVTGKSPMTVHNENRPARRGDRDSRTERLQIVEQLPNKQWNEYARPSRQEPQKELPVIRQNGLPTIKMRQVVDTDGHFNIRVKIIQVKKVFSLGDGNKKKIEFLGGDQTGIAPVVVDAFRFIKPGNVVHISNAKIYSFHGKKQVQQNLKGSYVNQMPGFNMDVSDNPIFGGRVPRKRENTQRQRQKSETEHSQDYSYSNRRDTRTRPERQRYQRQDHRLERVDREEKREFRRREHSREQEVKVKRREVNVRPQQRRKDEKQKSSSSIRSSSEQSNRKQEKVVAPSPKRNLKKIKDLQPGEQNINIMAEVTLIDPSSDRVDKSFLFCVIGDETGIVWAQLPQFHPDVKTNVVLYLECVEAAVHDKLHRIIIKLGKNSKIQRTSMRIPNINLDMDMSNYEWVSDSQEGEEDEKDEKEEEEEEASSAANSAPAYQNHVQDF